MQVDLLRRVRPQLAAHRGRRAGRRRPARRRRRQDRLPGRPDARFGQRAHLLDRHLPGRHRARRLRRPAAAHRQKGPPGEGRSALNPL